MGRWKAPKTTGKVRNLLLVFGDQLAPDAAIHADICPERDALLMLEVGEESQVVPSHVQRTILFLSAMRHFADDRVADGYRVHYVTLNARGNTQTLDGEIARALSTLRPEKLIVVQPGEHRIAQLVRNTADQANCPLDVREDPHFLTTRDEFAQWIGSRKQPLMEHFYRWQRKRLNILMTPDGQPEGDTWNFDKDNRSAFRKAPATTPPLRFSPDAITREVMDLVAKRFPKNPGDAASFAWPVTPTEAKQALDDFIENRLPAFGTYQDAMWTGEPFLNHALLSPPLNLRLLDPRACIAGALSAYEDGHAPLNSVEGFIRQIIGWREYIRGIYWHAGPEYVERNALQQHHPLPQLYWDAETDMHCLREAVGQVLSNGFGHHIQRLMVTGNFALLVGVDPRAISDWYLGMYVDAVDWVTLPNTLGMAMHADGGLVGTKPYAASGRYIDRMSNYCKDCRFDPAQRIGGDACPMTTLYWDFLLENADRLRNNHRMRMVLKNLDRFDEKETTAIRAQASAFRATL